MDDRITAGSESFDREALRKVVNGNENAPEDKGFEGIYKHGRASNVPADSSSPDVGKQAESKVINLDEKRPPTNYDHELVTDFIDFIFSGLPLDSPAQPVIATTKVGKRLGWVDPSDALDPKLARASKPSAFYYGAASVGIDPEHNRPLNRLNLFNALHVVVLDDIGTKVPISALPKGLKPSYIIESSEGNYQYGFVLEEPITDLAAAKLLIRVVYGSGLTDGGGSLVTKLVRLPAGVNGKLQKTGKASEATYFQVRLVEMSERLWTPEGLLDCIAPGLDWADALKDEHTALANLPKANNLLSHRSGPKPVVDTVRGITDPVFEYLQERGQVISEMLDGWFSVECIHADQHTEQTPEARLAYYSPVGHGSPAYVNRRSYVCFHDTCKTRATENGTTQTTDFLDWMEATTGKKYPSMDLAPELLARYAFAKHDSRFYLVDAPRDAGETIQVFDKVHKAACSFYDSKTQKRRYVTPSNLLLASETLLRVAGKIHDPSTATTLVVEDGCTYLNTCKPLDYGEGDIVQADVDKFVDYVNYLLPDGDDAKYFLDVISAKTQDITFKGLGILMIATTQGIGRTTLLNLILQMFGKDRAVNITVSDLVGGGQFNSWRKAAFAFVQETATNSKSKYSDYENVKSVIDPASRIIEINEKYTRQYCARDTTTLIMLSNHEDALSIPDNDRRIRVMHNPQLPKAPEFYGDLNQWANKGEWMVSVYRWLKSREVDLVDMVKPHFSANKHDMIIAGESMLDLAYRYVIELWPSPLMPAKMLFDTIKRIQSRGADFDERSRTIRFGLTMKHCYKAFGGDRVRLGGDNPQTAFLRRTADRELVTMLVDKEVTGQARLYRREQGLLQPTEDQRSALADKIAEKLTEE